MAFYTGSPAIFFGTILVVVTIGALIPLIFGARPWGDSKPSPKELRRSPEGART
jgi:hypothetical protein